MAAHTRPPKQGLYDPRLEHDSCGVGFLVHLKGHRSHMIVEKAIEALVSGASDGLLIDGVTLRLAQGEGKLIRGVGAALDEDPYVIAVSIKARELQGALLAALAALEENGQLDLLEDRWFGQVARRE